MLSRLGVSLPQPDHRDSDFRVVEIMNDFDLTGGIGGEGRAGGYGPLESLPWSVEYPWVSALLSRITIDPAICHGRPVIRGLRYPVEAMLEYLAAGDTLEDLLKEFPDLQREDLLACFDFAAQSLKLKSQHILLA